MEDMNILEAVERYIAGQMSPDERVHFEQLRKSNPEIDQAVVEHTFFLQQMNRFEETKKFKGFLNDAHINLAEKGLIESPRLKGKAKVVYLFNRYKRVSAIAASIAGITALTMSALIWSISPGKAPNDVKNDVELLKRNINVLKANDQILSREINKVKGQQDSTSTTPAPVYTIGGTGFLIDAKGYVVTNAHIIDNARNIAVQNSEGKEFKATTVYIDRTRDIAILKIDSKQFKSPGTIPYSIKKSVADLAEPIFTLGFPRNEIVYGEGYVAAKTAYEGDSLALQITIVANEGNSGGPVLNSNGEIIGILRGKRTSAEGAVFALHSKYIYSALAELKKSDTTYQKLKLPTTSQFKGMDKKQQVEKITRFVYMVKAS